MSQQTAVARRRIAGERARGVAVDGPTSSTRSAAAPAKAAKTSSSRPASRGKETVLRMPFVPAWLLIGLAVVAVLVLVFDGVSWARASSADARSSSTADLSTAALNEAPAQADKAAEQILAYDYADLRQDTAAAAAFMTPAYAQTFQRTVDDLLTSQATAQRGQVTAKVMASGVVSADAGKVDVLLFVDQTSTTKASTTPQTALNRVIFSMVEQDGRWLVDDVTAL